MKKFLVKFIFVIVSLIFLANCASNSHRDNIKNFRLDGKIVSVQKVTIKNDAKVAGVFMGVSTGASSGVASGYAGGNTAMGMLGGAIIGGVVSAIMNSNQPDKIECYKYVIKVNKSQAKKIQYTDDNKIIKDIISSAKSKGVIRVFQDINTKLKKNQKIRISISNRRIKVVAA
ncbi:MAG: hypothetical protein HRU36_05380 [Rickettsiales bacterium]|nr:hypothetical protein [Rickettsiales bacterium]